MYTPRAGIKRVLQTILFGRDFGLAVLGCKGLIALSGLNERTSGAAVPRPPNILIASRSVSICATALHMTYTLPEQVQPMTFRKAIRMVVLLRVFTRVRRRKGKKGGAHRGRKGLAVARANSENRALHPNMQRTMRVI